LEDKKKAGDEWLVTYQDHEVHVPDVFEEVIGEVRCISLTSRQFCTVVDPVDENGKPQLGQRKLLKGPTHFFLQPGERLSDAGICSVYVLAPEDALLVRAREKFEDVISTLRRNVNSVKVRQRNPGDRWFVYGPGEYVPPIHAEVVDRRSALLQLEPLGIFMFYSKFSLVAFVVLIIAIIVTLSKYL